MNAPAAKIDEENLPVGEILRRTRVYYNQSVDDVCAILRIRAAHLEAIEDGRIDDLPGRVYAFGFVRAYAEYLGLDGEQIVRLFKSQIGIQVVDRPDLHMPVAASESKSPNAVIVVGSLAFLAVAIGGLVFWGSQRQSGDVEVVDVHQIPPVPQKMYEDVGDVGPFPRANETAQSSPATGQVNDDVVADDSSTTDVAAGPPPLVLKLRDSAWVEIRDVTGKALLSRILKPGDSYIVPASVKGLVLDTGNVGALEFSIGNEIFAPLGEKGDVRRGIKLEPDYLRDLNKRNPRR